MSAVRIVWASCRVVSEQAFTCGLEAWRVLWRCLGVWPCGVGGWLFVVLLLVAACVVAGGGCGLLRFV